MKYFLWRNEKMSKITSTFGLKNALFGAMGCAYLVPTTSIIVSAHHAGGGGGHIVFSADPVGVGGGGLASCPHSIS